MFERLTEAGFGGRTRQVLQNLYFNDKILIEVNGELCKKVYLTNGLKQGCGLSPTLFNFMAKDIAFKLEEVRDSTRLGNIALNALFYADDLVVIASSKKKLKEKLDIITTVGGEFGMAINQAKSKRMEYGTVELVVEEREVESQLDMEIVDSFKYLGKWDVTPTLIKILLLFIFAAEIVEQQDMVASVLCIESL